MVIGGQRYHRVTAQSGSVRLRALKQWWTPHAKRRNFGRVDGTMAGRSFDPAVRGNRPLEMSKPALSRTSCKLRPWCKFVLLEEQVSEREFNEMSIDEKLDILQGCLSATRSARSRRRRPQPPSRLS